MIDELPLFFTETCFTKKPNMKKIFSEIYHSLRDFVFPPACIVCAETVSDDKFLCEACADRLQITASAYSPEKIVSGIDSVSILHPYDADFSKIIHALKYHGMPSVGVLLGEFMGRKTASMLTLPAGTIILPIPLHPKRLAERGYNQSERIADGFSSATGFRVNEGILERIKNTGTQTALDAESRGINMQGAFRYSGVGTLYGTTLVIVDDVMTTGSTVSECAVTLREAGAEAVYVSVAASPNVGDD